jgi:hypothetical protein
LGIDRLIGSAYEFLARTYQDGDRILSPRYPQARDLLDGTLSKSDVGVSWRSE